MTPSDEHNNNIFWQWPRVMTTTTTSSDNDPKWWTQQQYLFPNQSSILIIANTAMVTARYRNQFYSTAISARLRRCVNTILWNRHVLYVGVPKQAPHDEINSLRIVPTNFLSKLCVCNGQSYYSSMQCTSSHQIRPPNSWDTIIGNLVTTVG